MEFRILGPLEVDSDGQTLNLGGAKQRALLAMLLLHANEVVSRDRLVEALWESDPPETAHKALQMYVSGVRKLLGKGRLETRPPGYLIRVADDELDLTRFQQLRDEGRFTEALALWRGPPLSDFAYDGFAQPEIIRLEDQRLTCIEERVDQELDGGRHAELTGELEALVEQHPLRERLRGQLMLALYRSGRQAEALEAYQRARTVLVDELGIEPGRHLRVLHQQILNQDGSLDHSASGAAAEDGAAGARGIFVGRVNELAEVAAALDEALAGRGGLIFLVGEPGIGKSRLSEELMRSARARGALTLVGRCWEAGGAPAYWPWVQSLRSYIRSAPPARLREELGSSTGELTQLFPELKELVPDVPEPPASDAESARFRLFDAVSTLIRNAAKRQALVLVLDDLHAADEPSLLLLRFLGRELAGTRVLVVAASRNIDPSPSEPLAAALTELAREPGTRTMLLRGLGAEDVRRFLELTTGDAPDESLVAAIHEETEGNPLFVGEIVRLLSAEGSLRGDAPARLAIPQSIRDVIARRLRRLSDECLRLLTLASVLGREFSIAVLARAAGITEDDVLDTLDEAMRERVVTDVPSVPSELRFAHALIRDALYEDLTTARRIRLHRQAVQALEALYGEGLSSLLAELAHHSIAGSDFERGVRYARRAADRALELLAYEEAARLYKTALETLELSEPGDDRTRCELLLALGDAQGKAGNTPEAKETLLAAADIARSAGLPEHLGRAALYYGGRFPWLRAGNDRRLVPLLEEALAGLSEDESQLKVRLLARLAGALRDQPSLEPRSSLSREAVAIARRLEDADTLGYALVSLTTATWSPEIEELVPYVEEVKKLAEETRDTGHMFQWGWLRHIILMNLGDIAAAEEIAVQHRALAWELKQPSQQWYSTVMRSLIPLVRGEFAEAEQLADEALQLGRRAQSWDAAFSHCILLFAVRREQGRLEEVDQLVQSFVHEYPGYRSFRCLVPLIDWELGRTNDAHSRFEELAADGFDALPRDGEWVFNVSVLAQIAVYLDDRARAGILYDLLLPYAQRNATLTGEIAIGSVSRYLGSLAALLGRWDDAERHFGDALEMNGRMTARPWVAHTQEDFGRMLLERGEIQRGSQLIAAALATYRELGMERYAARAHELVKLGAAT
jgi:DNA-binding SARP family transcriptional activator/tetratricopeptide (TPR) repeat protein